MKAATTPGHRVFGIPTNCPARLGLNRLAESIVFNENKQARASKFQIALRRLPLHGRVTLPISAPLAFLSLRYSA